MTTLTTTAKTPFRMNEWMREASNAIQQSGEREIVVDMSSVRRVCSEDLNELIRLHLELQTQGRKLVLENALDHVAQVFSLTRLDRVLELRQRALVGSDPPVF
jgi:anti-anti-sigma factor